MPLNKETKPNQSVSMFSEQFVTVIFFEWVQESGSLKTKEIDGIKKQHRIKIQVLGSWGFVELLNFATGRMSKCEEFYCTNRYSHLKVPRRFVLFHCRTFVYCWTHHSVSAVKHRLLFPPSSAFFFYMDWHDEYAKYIKDISGASFSLVPHNGCQPQHILFIVSLVID